MISVIMALAVAQLLVGIAGLVQTRHVVRPSVTHGLWAIDLFLLAFLHWWSLWDFRSLEWTFPAFMFSLAGPTLLFFAATLINPRDLTDDPIDLRLHFESVRRPMMWVLLVTMVFMTLDGPLFGTEETINWLRMIQVVIVGGLVASLFSANPRVHAAAGLTTLLALGAGMFIRFFPGVIAG